MSCCGNKRRGWSRGKSAPSPGSIENESASPAREQRPVVFEYTGRAPLSVKGVHSGVIYRFRFSGEQILIPYEDTFALMAERELRVVG